MLELEVLIGCFILFLVIVLGEFVWVYCVVYIKKERKNGKCKKAKNVPKRAP